MSELVVKCLRTEKTIITHPIKPNENHWQVILNAMKAYVSDRNLSLTSSPVGMHEATVTYNNTILFQARFNIEYHDLISP